MVPNIKHAILEMKERGITIVGTDASARDMFWDVDFTIPLALVIGSEGKGLRKTVGSLCDVLAKIPMCGKINSLNVSVAAGIFAFEILRQRSQKTSKKGE
jgi:23S rRNA (guanosine2251-2'-O)-methyltransferase